MNAILAQVPSVSDLTRKIILTGMFTFEGAAQGGAENSDAFASSPEFYLYFDVQQPVSH